MAGYKSMKDQCPNYKNNMKHCTCTYEPCDKKGLCCQCISYHRERGELPGCYFPPEVERTYDRSIKRFVSLYAK